MAVERNIDIAGDYRAWLRDRITAVNLGDSQILTTPFLDPFNDGIEIAVEPRGGEIVLHDAGRTLETLSLLGVDAEKSERRQALIDRVTVSSGVRLTEGRLETTATHANLAQRIHFLLTSIIRLNDLWMSAVPHSWSDFSELVAEFLNDHSTLYTRDVSIPGKTVDHPVDFVIPLPRQRERLVKVVASPNPQAAKLISFTWMELRESRPNAERVVVLNDLAKPDPLSGETATDTRRVSDQALAILRGYSTTVHRWSARNDPAFESFWKAA